MLLRRYLLKYIKQNERIGLTKLNKNGTEMKIIKVQPDDKLIIEFQDEHKFKKEIHWNNFKNGRAKNPYDKLINGAGYVGVGNYKTVEPNGKLTRIYVTWHDMLVRCYKEKVRHLHPSYEGCTMCDKWLNFQNFAKWYEKNYYDIGEGRMHLDKDILCIGNKVYSPEYCVFVPQRINMIFMSKPNKDNLPSGISRSITGRYTASYNTKGLGTYNTLEEALMPYNKAKMQHIHNVAEEYKNRIPKRLYNVLKNYKL